MSTENQNQMPAATEGCAAAAGYVVTAWRQAGNGLRCMPQPRIVEHPHRSGWPTKDAARAAAKTMQELFPGWHWQITNPHTAEVCRPARQETQTEE